jgi:transcriptional regulator with XRE-family HTH domain
MFLDAVNRLMAEKKITRSELARSSGIPYTTIDGWYKKGFDNVRLSTLLRLAKFFEVTLDFLVDEAENEKSESLTEIRFIKRYGQLDRHGRVIVDFILEEEIRRIEAETERAAAFNSSKSGDAQANIGMQCETEEHDAEVLFMKKASAVKKTW